MRTVRAQASGTRPWRPAVVAALVLLAGCQPSGPGYPGAPPGGVWPMLGTLGGAGAGALAGRLIAGGHDNGAAILGGAPIGGLGGMLGTSVYNRDKQQQQQQQATQQQLGYTQAQLAQQESLNQQLESQRVYQQWGGSHGYMPPPPDPAQVKDAQRMLTALAYYNGPVDGLMGPATSSAIANFQRRQGQPVTGVFTPGLLDQLRVCVGAYQRCVAGAGRRHGPGEGRRDPRRADTRGSTDRCGFPPSSP